MSGDWRKPTAVIVVLLLILVGVLIYRSSRTPHSYKSDCGCIIEPGATGPFVSGFIHERFVNPNDGNITNNNGGWNLRVATVCNEVPLDKADVMIDGYYSPGFKFEVPKLSGQTWSFKIKNGSEDWYVYSNSSVYYSNNGKRTLVDPKVNPIFTENELRTLENVTMIYMDRYDQGHLSSGDQFIVYSDVDGDRLAELKGGYGAFHMKWYNHWCVSETFR